MEYCEFCDTKYRKMVKYMSVRWLNLDIVVERILRQYDGLKFYFLSVNGGTPRFQRLKAHFDDSMTLVYVMFYQAILPMFTRINLLLQMDASMIHIIQDTLFLLIRKTLGKLLNLNCWQY